MPPATFIGVPVNQEVGRKLEDVFFQPQFHQDNGVFQWIEQLIKYLQLLVGIVPQTYGGSDKDIKTAAGQEQALKTAMGVLWLYWNLLRAEWAHAANVSVDCFAENATDDEYAATKSEDEFASKQFEKEPIRLADLGGKADARPEANQNYPIGYEQQQQLYKELFAMASGKEPNPLVMEVLDTYNARRQAMRYLGPNDMELPEAIFVHKVLADIQQLVSGNPLPAGQNPDTGEIVMKPSVEPDPDYFGSVWDVVIDTVVRYAIKNYESIPRGSAADTQIRGYYKLCIQFRQAQQMAATSGPALLTAGAPGWGGNLGGPRENENAPPPAPTGQHLLPPPPAMPARGR
jgi:hypothetical protein